MTREELETQLAAARELQKQAQADVHRLRSMLRGPVVEADLIYYFHQSLYVSQHESVKEIQQWIEGGDYDMSPQVIQRNGILHPVRDEPYDWERQPDDPEMGKVLTEAYRGW